MDIKQNLSGGHIQTSTNIGQPSKDSEAETSLPLSRLVIRTMAKDIDDLSKKAGPGTASLSAKPAAMPGAVPPSPVAPLPRPAAVAPVQKTTAPPPDLPVTKEIKPIFPAPPKIPAPPVPPTPAFLAKPPSPPLPATLTPRPPLPTPMPSLPKPPVSLPPKPGHKLAWGKIALIAGILIVISLGASGWFYWQNIKPEPTTSATPSSTPTPLVLPSPLFSMDEQREIELTAAPKTNPNEITQIFSPLEEESVFAQIIFETSDENGQKKIPTLSELSALADFESFVLSLANYLQPEKYSFFVYKQTETGSSPFSGDQRGRLGFVVALQDAQKAEELSQKLKELEPSIPTNLKGLLADKDVYLPDTISFLDNTYKNIPIRYINFPTAALSIDYALVNDMLVIATSRESMYAAVDRLLNVATSSMADWQTYKNDKYGLELKIPNDITITIQKMAEDDTYLEFINNSLSIGFINIAYKSKFQTASLLKFAENYPTPADKIETKSETSKQIASINAVEQNITFTQQDEKVKNGTWFYFENSQYYFIFGFYASNNLEIQNKLNQIISTFKFIPR